MPVDKVLAPRLSVVSISVQQFVQGAGDPEFHRVLSPISAASQAGSIAMGMSVSMV